MNRQEIVNRINQKLYEEMYSFEDIKYDMDDAIIAINNKMNSNFPMISEVLVGENSNYEYIPEGSETPVPIFPEKYIRSIVVEFTVATLLRRQGDFTDEYSAAVLAYEDGLNVMFRDFYEKVPDVFADNEGGIMPLTNQEVIMETDTDGQPIPGTEVDFDTGSTEMYDRIFGDD